MKLWVDDIRPMPEDYDIHVRSSDAAINVLKHFVITEISLDHDLGSSNDKTGYTVACFIEERAKCGQLSTMKWNIHSSNPVGVAKIKSALLNADKYWQDKNDGKD